MKYYWLVWLLSLMSILLYSLGMHDNMEDVIKDCNNKNELIADGVKYICISHEEYFK